VCSRSCISQQNLRYSVRKTSVGWLLKRLSVEIDREMVKQLRPHSLSINQFGIVMTLLECDGLSQSEIGKRIDMPGYATTRNIDILESGGFFKALS